MAGWISGRVEGRRERGGNELSSAKVRPFGVRRRVPPANFVLAYSGGVLLPVTPPFMRRLFISPGALRTMPNDYQRCMAKVLRTLYELRSTPQPPLHSWCSKRALTRRSRKGDLPSSNPPKKALIANDESSEKQAWF